MFLAHQMSKTTLHLVLMVSAVLVVRMLFLEPIAQDPAYHQFMDTRTIFGIANFWNLISNIPFLIIGLLGLLMLKNRLCILTEIKFVYAIFFIAIIAIGFGSSYYHLNPNNDTLFWDRLPIAIGFMALSSIVIGEFISTKYAKRLALPLILCGASSVLYWYLSEKAGHGDLRFYVTVQFLPILLLPVILLSRNACFSYTSGYWGLWLCYLIAKIFETYDRETYDLLYLISGHSLKHIVAAIGIFFLYTSFRKRQRI